MEQAFPNDSKRIIFGASASDIMQRSQVREPPRKRQILKTLRTVVVLCGVLTLATWTMTGLSAGYFGSSRDDNEVGFGWVWGSGGEGYMKRKKKVWRFEEITPTEHLDWKPCGGDFVCARLDVPMDYRNDKDQRRAAIALIKLPAKTPPLPGQHQPSILVNPGGPGGSGVSLALAAGVALQTITGLQYSIIGFDPRGVNNTTPSFDCFEANPIARNVWMDQFSSILLNTSTNSVGEAWAMAFGVGKQCSESTGGLEESVGRHLSTPVVAADMLSIVEAEQREAGLDPKDGKLWYFGFSYGSVLGTTFATMYPDRVGRVIVDGIVDVEDYYAGKWTTNLDDTEKVMDSFYQYCFEAGPERCSFFTSGSPSAIRERMYKLMTKLKERPLSVYKNTQTGKPEILTFGSLKLLIFISLYSPLQTFPFLADACLAFENGDGEAAVKILRKAVECDCHSGLRPWDAREVGPAIYCSDANGSRFEYEEFITYVDDCTKISPTFGDIWPGVSLFCVGWDLKPAWPFEGELKGDTSFPLLFIGNTADPVTPLRNAHKMVKGYKDAVVLTQNSEGHCSISGVSLCTMYNVRRYFAEGKLPAQGIVCEVQYKPFTGKIEEENLKSIFNDEDLKMVEALQEVSRAWGKLLI